MKSFQHSAVLIILYFYYFKEFALADKTSRIFGYKKEYFGKTCPIVDRLFTMTIRRKTACVEKCARTTGCTAVTFLERNLMCTGCNGFYPSSISLDDQSETLFYIVDCGKPEVSHNDIELETFNGNSLFGAKMTYVCKAPIFHHHIDNITCLSDGKWSIAQCEFVDCGTPTVGSHVQLGPYNGYSRYGAQVEFRCTPCTYFSLSSTSHIRCQADGSWTIPDCVYGPDVGLLKNGLVIPTWAVGCNSSLGSTCVEENEVHGTVLRYNGQIADTCFCDSVCCSETDCCYDYKC